MTISFTRTRNQIADAALRKLGIIAAGQTAASADSDVCYEAIDLRLKEMHRLGIVWRKVDETPLSFSLTANINSASASVDILFPIAMTLLDGSLDMAVDIISPQEYAAIQNKAEQGVPTHALWKGSAEFLFHPIQTAATTAKLVYERIMDDTSASAATDIEVSMIRWLKDIVAYDVADDFGIPEQKMVRLERESQRAEINIRRLNAQHVDLTTVVVDEFDTGRTRTETDYWMR